MSETLIEWVIVFSFFFLVVGFTIVEAFWLNRKTWASFGKSLLFSTLTNLIGYSIGFFVVFVILSVILMITLDGSINKFPTGDFGLMALLICAILFTPVLLTIGKRILLSILKMQSGKSAWLYAVVSSVSGFLISLVVPVLIGYFSYR